MSKKDENMEWEEEATYLASLPRTSPYRVPENYFDELTTKINQSVFLADLTQKENQGFTVPTNYFEELTLQIESRIALEGIKDLGIEEGFKVPENYFSKLESNILARTTGNNNKPIVKRLWSTSLIKYASAACFFLMAVTALYVNQQYNLKQTRTEELASEQMLYDIDESVIIEHLRESQTTNATATDKELESYILDNYSSSDLSNNL